MSETERTSKALVETQVALENASADLIGVRRGLDLAESRVLRALAKVELARTLAPAPAGDSGGERG